MYSFHHSVPETDTGLPAKSITHTIDSEDVNLDEMLTTFEDFLKGCGYVFDGHVTIEDPDYSREDDCSDCSCHVDDDRICQGDSETLNPNPNVQTEFNFEQLKAHREENGNGI